MEIQAQIAESFPGVGPIFPALLRQRCFFVGKIIANLGENFLNFGQREEARIVWDDFTSCVLGAHGFCEILSHLFSESNIGSYVVWKEWLPIVRNGWESPRIVLLQCFNCVSIKRKG